MNAQKKPTALRDALSEYQHALATYNPANDAYSHIELPKLLIADAILVSLGISTAPEHPEFSKPVVIKRFVPATMDEVKLFCSKSGISEHDAEWFFYKMEGCGWKNNGKCVKSWQMTLRSWDLAGYLGSQQKAKSLRQFTPDLKPQKRASDGWATQKDLEDAM